MYCKSRPVSTAGRYDAVTDHLRRAGMRRRLSSRDERITRQGRSMAILAPRLTAFTPRAPGSGAGGKVGAGRYSARVQDYYPPLFE